MCVHLAPLGKTPIFLPQLGSVIWIISILIIFLTLITDRLSDNWNAGESPGNDPFSFPIIYWSMYEILIAGGGWFPPGTLVSSTSEPDIWSSFHLDMGDLFHLKQEIGVRKKIWLRLYGPLLTSVAGLTGGLSSDGKLTCVKKKWLVVKWASRWPTAMQFPPVRQMGVGPTTPVRQKRTGGGDRLSGHGP